MNIQKIAILFCISCSVMSCNSQRELPKTEVDSVANINQVKNIEGFLMEDTYDMVTYFSTIEVFDIEKKLVDSTAKEYSNQLVFRKGLNKEEGDAFIVHLLDDSSYNWQAYTEDSSYEPTKQLIIKMDSEQLSLLYDPESKILGFINLEGQQTLPVSERFHEILLNM
ncbi:hypothetical protein ACFQO1_07080 [Jejudonia soesokkakensis]|uniref:Uncharacterized protein n=1 Tax=Jejudonia soesokkakensis TaxID=1323432 RepID=A0ABW2MT75_9FLAO